MKRLNATQAAQWEERGFVIGIDLLDAARVAQLAGRISAFMNVPEEALTSVHSFQLAPKFALIDDALPDDIGGLARDPVLLDYIEDTIGSEIMYMCTNLFFKLPNRGVLSWHTGREHLPVLAADGSGRQVLNAAVTAWLPLVDVARDNGCLQAIPGSNRYTDEQVASWMDEWGDKYVFEFERVAPDALAPTGGLEPVPFEMRAGRIALLSESVIHGSGVNTSDRPRCALSVRYFSTGVIPRPDMTNRPRFKKAVRVR